ncbi:MAG: exo-alpha-sialidase [Deltaproteobacteria bacterium]|nr:exo-alpha-sialidase [Deltaproteobacteria bacterium]
MAWLLAVGGDAGIYLRRSTDGGKVWSIDQRVSNEGCSAYPPALAVNSGAIHVAWIDYGERIEGELYYSRSLDGGDTWEKNKILVDETNSARYPLLMCKADHVYMIWQDVENKTYFKASHDRGLTWMETKLLANLDRHSCYCYPPTMCVNKDELSVAWTNVREDRGFHLLFKGLPLHSSRENVVSTVVRRTSSDAGVTWGNEQILVKTKVSKEVKDEIDNPMMLSDGPLSHLFWLDKRNLRIGEIYYACVDFKKDRFPIDGKKLVLPEKRSPKRPAVAIDHEKRFHLTWTSFLGGTSIVNYCQSDLEGKVLIDKKGLTSDTGRFHNPVITVTSSGLLNVYWFDEPKDEWSRIFSKTSKDNGLTWEEWEHSKKDL